MRFRWLVSVAGVIWGVLLASGTAALASSHPTLVPWVQPGSQSVIFADIDDDHWAAKYVLKAKLTSVIQGYADQTFRPDRLVTREEAIAMVIRTLGLGQQALNSAQQNSALPYQDSVTISPWAKGYVILSRQMGLLDPNEAVLQPSTPASRLWLLEILVRALGYSSQDVSKAAGTSLPFIDTAAIPSSERGYVAIAYGLGIIGGYPDNTFRPNNPVTRAESVRLLDSFQAQLQQPVAAPAPSQTQQANVVTGRVYAVSSTTLTVTLADSTNAVYSVSYGTYIFVNDRPAVLADIRPGYLVSLYLDNAGKVLLIDARLRAPQLLSPVPPVPPVPGPQLPPGLSSRGYFSGEVYGSISAVNGTQMMITIDTVGGSRLDLYVAPWAKVEFPGDVRGTLDDLTPGDLVEVKVSQGVITKIEVKQVGSVTGVSGSWTGAPATSSGSNGIGSGMPTPPVYQGMPAAPLYGDYHGPIQPDAPKYKEFKKEKKGKHRKNDDD